MPQSYIKGVSTNSYWLVIQGYVTYLTNCLLTCQSGTIGSIIQQKLYNTGSSINYPSVSIIKNGATLLANIIASSSQLYYVSAISKIILLSINRSLFVDF